MEFSEFERFCKIKGLRPVDKYEIKGATIAIAETDWENDRKLEFPFGYYQTLFAAGGKASKGEVDVAQWFDFDAFHDKEAGLTLNEKRESRVRATKLEAEKFVKTNIELGRYA